MTNNDGGGDFSSSARKPIIDFLLMLFLALLAYVAPEFIIQQIRDKKELSEKEILKISEELKIVDQDVKAHSMMTQEIQDIESNIGKVAGVGHAKVNRHRPVIVLEHLQNLRPEGVWFWQLDIDDVKSQVKILGQSYDHLLIAEYMSSLMSTMKQNIDPQDLRTQVFFKRASTIDTKIQETPRNGFSDLVGYPEFNLELDYDIRLQDAQPEQPQSVAMRN